MIHSDCIKIPLRTKMIQQGVSAEYTESSFLHLFCSFCIHNQLQDNVRKRKTHKSSGCIIFSSPPVELTGTRIRKILGGKRSFYSTWPEKKFSFLLSYVEIGVVEFFNFCSTSLHNSQWHCKKEFQNFKKRRRTWAACKRVDSEIGAGYSNIRSGFQTGKIIVTARLISTLNEHS